ncbi:lipopolysaccharide-induced tumor necrosis factor-alpha factor homolog-like [Cololabis saira]|uniref:lipopolysaccharide-induced tumor necrosis factor-alpha factor homolog-like n=1 Tax=Cololabis saira TaxID=129043 RepID=UPI002AD2C63E|nr:lipopolysaccharide-induced tumor necrosis factor-alpha factor homolog-like [Cololabis saira]
MTSERAKEPPPYLIPGESSGVKVYHVHTPFTPPTQQDASATQINPVFTGGTMSPSVGASEDKKKYVSYEGPLGRTPARTTCSSCQKQVMTDVQYKAGTYAWLMCLLFICCGLILCCCLIPFFLNNFKDAYHKCPHCQRVLYVDKKQCCK